MNALLDAARLFLEWLDALPYGVMLAVVVVVALLWGAFLAWVSVALRTRHDRRRF